MITIEFIPTEDNMILMFWEEDGAKVTTSKPRLFANGAQFEVAPRIFEGKLTSFIYPGNPVIQ